MGWVVVVMGGCSTHSIVVTWLVTNGTGWVKASMRENIALEGGRGRRWEAHGCEEKWWVRPQSAG